MFARAFAIHIMTACGAALGLLALVMAVGQQWPAMFFCMGLALLVDGLDGPLAREFKVAETLPRWSGDVLDLVVDYVNYVFVPAYAIAASGLLPDMLSILGAIVIVVTGALYFADRKMKTDGNYFHGFPAAWNLVAFYLFLIEPPAWLGLIMILVLAGLTFAPVFFVHPLRVREARNLSLALLGLWVVLALIALGTNLSPGRLVTGALIIIAMYFLATGAYHQRQLAGRT
ncbi:MAG: phosphatidylcholine synthase [Pseudolabrys sp.]|nr:phosphatidylcholine synthase [Pseudolabrys sp.]MBV9954002.1 phosphatidylcholine synthase [Pseudolabrys sp.]